MATKEEKKTEKAAQEIKTGLKQEETNLKHIKEDQEIAKVLQSEVQTLQSIQNNIDKILVINKELKQTKQLQDDYAALKKEILPPASKFRKTLRAIAQIKYWFITNPDKVIKQNLQDNTKIMGEIDHSLQKIGGQSLIVHGMIRDELEQGFKEVEKKNQRSFTNELSKQYIAVNKATMDSDLKKIFADIYTKDEIAGLTTQNENLSTIKSNINILINKNQAIQALKPLQRQINTIQEAIPKSYFEKIQNFFSKINNVFKENSKKALPHLIIQNNEKLYDITEELKVAEAKISRSHQLRREKLDHQLRKLLSEKMDPQKRAALNALLEKVEGLEAKYTAAALGIERTEPGQPNISEDRNSLIGSVL